MLRRPVKEINAEFLAEEKYLDSIQRTVAESCVAAGLSRKDTQAVQLAVEEAATNIIRHAYLYEKGVLRLRIVIYRRMMVISLIDFGRSFQPESSARLDLEQLVQTGRKGGLGFYMIQKIMDSVEYITTAEFNEMRMFKRIHQAAGEGRPLLRRLFTLRAQFSFWTFLIVAVIVGAAYYYIDRKTSEQIYDHLDRRVEALAKTIADQATGYIVRSRSDVEFDELVVSYIRANPVLTKIVLVDTAGLIITHSEELRYKLRPYNLPDWIDSLRIGEPMRHRFGGGERINFLAMPLRLSEKSYGFAYVTYSSEEIAERLAASRRNFIFFTLALLLVGVGGIYLLSNYFVRPIVQITRRVRRFTSGDLTTELPLEGAEEFFEISRAFNEMMTRLSQDRENIVAREKMAKEIEVASQIQKTLLPNNLPEPKGLELDTFYRAASIVGGDLYDAFHIAEQRYCLVIADVSGKGVPASLVMSMLRTVIQIHAHGSNSARQTLVKVNEYLAHNIPPGMFITIQLIIYDAVDRCIRMVSAGHNPLLLYRRAERAVHQVNPRGMPLGLPVTIEGSFESSLEEVVIELKDGDMFLAFTDGINEAVDREGRQFGLERLESFLLTSGASDNDRALSSLSNILVQEIEDFVGFNRPSDDISFILARAMNITQPATDQPDEQLEVRHVSGPTDESHSE